jgi:hypothetical protein
MRPTANRSRARPSSSRTRPTPAGAPPLCARLDALLVQHQIDVDGRTLSRRVRAVADAVGFPAFMQAFIDRLETPRRASANALDNDGVQPPQGLDHGSSTGKGYRRATETTSRSNRQAGACGPDAASRREHTQAGASRSARTRFPYPRPRVRSPCRSTAQRLWRQFASLAEETSGSSGFGEVLS